jgi:hypothetical protein
MVPRPAVPLLGPTLVVSSVCRAAIRLVRCRFPIGRTEQVKTWPHETLKGFWERW